MTSSGEERARLPFEASSLPGRRWLVLAPHPDDEVLGPGGTLAEAVTRGVGVRVVVVTDGSAGGSGGDLVERRRRESCRAAAELGLDEPRFLGLADRSLSSDPGPLREALAELIAEEPVDLILVPSLLELHPDHRALAAELVTLLAAARVGEILFEAARHADLAFYEVATPIVTPNVLVDVTTTIERKRQAMAVFESQQQHDYGAVADGLLALRRLSLDASVEGAEAFFRLPVAELAAHGPVGVERRLAGTASGGEAPTEPISVVVRTRNRPALLHQALESLASGRVRPHQVVVVNDGGLPVDEVVGRFRDRLDLVAIGWDQPRGRVAAANAGAESVSARWLSFLDDDDRVYPDHLETLGRALASGGAPVVYTDAVTTIYRRRDETAEWELAARHLQYSHDFDASLLKLFNYLPLHTVAIPTELWRRLGGFDPELDLSEDWDFLIRLSSEVPFEHVRRVTCEYRVFEGPGAPVHAPAGSDGFRRARDEIYRRHGVLSDAESLGSAVDALRRQGEALVSRNWNLDGERWQARRERQDAERRLLEARAEFERLGERITELERERNQVRDDLARQQEATRAVEARLGSLVEERNRLTAERARLDGALAAAGDTEKALREQISAMDVQLASTWEEIERLNGILRQVEQSKVWRLHRLGERLRGRGGGS